MSLEEGVNIVKVMEILRLKCIFYPIFMLFVTNVKVLDIILKLYLFDGKAITLLKFLIQLLRMHFKYSKTNPVYLEL